MSSELSPARQNFDVPSNFGRSCSTRLLSRAFKSQDLMSHKLELAMDDDYKSCFIICALVIQGGEKQQPREGGYRMR